MKRIIFAICVALLGTGVSWARKAVVWDRPAIGSVNLDGDGYFAPCMEVTRVELRDDETLLHATIRMRSDASGAFGFSYQTHIRVGEKDYAMLSVDGLEPCAATLTGKDDRLDVVFHFQPVPRGTKAIDFVGGEGNGFHIEGIRSASDCWDTLVPSYWRNEATGDWEIAFMDSCAIYDCKFWQYERRDIDPKTGRAEMTLRCGDEELAVSVGKNRKGRREMRIGQERMVCSLLTGRYLPDYPVADTRTDFADNGYKADTITVAGWLKDMPDRFRQRRTIGFRYTDIFSDDYVETFADLDGQGRFTVRIPVYNSTEFMCDWERSNLRTMLEPGRTYFMLYDFKEGRRYFMGDDARLQNELLRFPVDWNCVRMGPGIDMDRYVASVDSLLTSHPAHIDSLCAARPSLSARFRAYRKGYSLWQQAGAFMQARYWCKGRRFPDNAKRYARDNFWPHLPTQLTMYEDINDFLREYLFDVDDLLPDVMWSWKIQDHIDELASNDTERDVLARAVAYLKEASALIKAAPVEERKALSEKLDADNARLLGEVYAILNGEHAHRFVNDYAIACEMKGFVHVFDSLRTNQAVRDVWTCRLVLDRMNQNCRSMPQFVLDTLRTLVGTPMGVERVEQRNAYFHALENREFDSLVLKQSADLQGISEGKALLDKILEPFRGKMVLLDVWGTWCGPCREALKHSTEEYARLSKYDIAYVYLANKSPQDSWENFIKMHNVSGENVAHYNLPAGQQEAIERYLGVNSFPTYKLFDRNGNLMDVKVDARDLDSLERLLKRL